MLSELATKKSVRCELGEHADIYFPHDAKRSRAKRSRASAGLSVGAAFDARRGLAESFRATGREVDIDSSSPRQLPLFNSSFRPSSNLSHRSAFTLLELLLTLSVLAAIAAVAIPQIGTLLGDRRVVRAADQLRIEMTGLRVEAMRGGRVMMLQCLLDEGQFRMRSFYSLADATEAIDQTGSQSTLLNGADQASVADDHAARR